MLTAIKTKLFELYIYMLGRDALNDWVRDNWNTIPTEVMTFATEWVSKHIDPLVRRNEYKSVLEIPEYWPARWRDELHKYLQANELSVSDKMGLRDPDDDSEDPDYIYRTVVWWDRDSYRPKSSGVGLLWRELLECHAKHVDNEKFAADIFFNEIKPKLAIGEVVFISSVLWAQYGKYIGAKLHELRARTIYNAGRECYAIALPHKARWEDAPLYNNDVTGEPFDAGIDTWEDADVSEDE